MFEIGSEFWKEKPAQGKGVDLLLPKGFDIRYTLCGRTALDIVIEDLIQEGKLHSVFMPSYCCHTMIEPFLKHNIRVVFYSVTIGDDGLEASFMENDCDIVFLIDYFGYLDSKTIEFAKSEKNQGKTIIYDMTQSLFCDFEKEPYFDYIFGSFKKWMGVNAGFAAKKKSWTVFPVLKSNNDFVELRNKAFDLKKRFIRNPSSVDKSTILRLFSQAEKKLEEDYKYYGSDNYSLNILSSVDIHAIRERRIANSRVLIDGLMKIDEIKVLYKEVKENECPLFVPICLDRNRDELRKFLIDRAIYLPIHWPISSLHRLNSSNRLVFDSELSCVCDQRYEKQDMLHIVEVIKLFFSIN